jgi:toxin-antitoxin system PIN domain toxin
MRALLDVNVLIALLDAAHVHHLRARTWLTANIEQGWASCPITQNGCVRIISQSAYPKAVSTAQAIELLRGATRTDHHTFWADQVSILDDTAVIANRIHGPRQLTDLYSLALAVRQSGRFVTFDGSIAVSAVRGAGATHCVVL